MILMPVFAIFHDDEYNDPIAINVNHITAFNNEQIWIVNDPYPYDVKESYEEIKAIISESVKKA